MGSSSKFIWSEINNYLSFTNVYCQNIKLKVGFIRKLVARIIESLVNTIVDAIVVIKSLVNAIAIIVIILITTAKIIIKFTQSLELNELGNIIIVTKWVIW